MEKLVVVAPLLDVASGVNEPIEDPSRGLLPNSSPEGLNWMHSVSVPPIQPRNIYQTSMPMSVGIPNLMRQYEGRIKRLDNLPTIIWNVK